MVAIARYAPSIGTKKLSSPVINPAELPNIVEAAKRWAVDMQKMAIEKGVSLTPEQLKIAEKMGVQYPEKIRLVIGEIPKPTDEKVLLVMQNLDLQDNIQGWAFGYGVFIADAQKDNVTVLSHEFRHVKQSEDFGSIAHFVETYVEQVNIYGYAQSGFEQDACKKQLR